jgi:antirestriction protein ArdC
MRNPYQTITDEIVRELKAGTRPWIQPWSQTPGRNLAANAVSGRPYSGINTLLLWTARREGWPQPRFLTFKQALEAGGHVRKGEHGRHVVFVKDLLKRSTEEDGEAPGIIRMMKSYVVFNMSQCDGLPDKITTLPKGPNLDQRDTLIDEFIAGTGAKVIERNTADEAFYSRDLDVIVLPAFTSFNGQAQYYATQFHELIHWTGHRGRLNRELGVRFGTQARAAEELIAELGAAFLCAEFSIDGVVPHAAYIESYLELLADDPKAIFTAASKAQAAVDFLRERLLKESEQAAEVRCA